jgi:hypothetical protein
VAFRHLRGIEIGDADVADLALVDHRAERRRGLRERRGGIGPVDLVEVDDVDPEVDQALLHPAAKKRGARIAVRPAALHAQATLGGDDQILAPRAQLVGQRTAQDPLRDAEPIGLCRVEEVDAEVEGLADRPDRLLFVDVAPIAAELPRPVGDRRDLES